MSTYVASGTPDWFVGAAGTRTVNIPGGASAGNLLVLQIVGRDGSGVTFSNVTGWSSLQTSTINLASMALYTREMQSGDTTVSYDFTPAAFVGGVVHAFDDVTTLSAVQVDASINASSLATGHTSSDFLAPNGDLIASFIGFRYGRTPTSINVNAGSIPPWTERFASIYPGPNAEAMGLATAVAEGQSGRWHLGIGMGTNSAPTPGVGWDYGGTIDDRPVIFHQFSMS